MRGKTTKVLAIFEKCVVKYQNPGAVLSRMLLVQISRLFSSRTSYARFANESLLRVDCFHESVTGCQNNLNRFENDLFLRVDCFKRIGFTGNQNGLIQFGHQVQTIDCKKWQIQTNCPKRSCNSGKHVQSEVLQVKHFPARRELKH